MFKSFNNNCFGLSLSSVGLSLKSPFEYLFYDLLVSLTLETS